MIDIFDRVFGIVYEAVKAVSPNASILKAYTPTPPAFPCVTVQEIDNVSTVTVIGTRRKEPYARITYQIDVYSNKSDGRESECRALMVAISNALIPYNFNRTMLSPTPNYADATISRLTARFQVIADDKNNTYRR